MPGRVLIVDDDRSTCELIEDELRLQEFETASFSTAEAAFEQMRQTSFDVVLADLNLPGMSGIDLCRRVSENWPGIPVVVITAFGSMEAAVEAVRAGAYDFVTKPFDLEMLTLVLQRALRHRSLQEQVKVLSEAVGRKQEFDEIFGTSRPMQRLFDEISRAAKVDTTVLITGENGTGKELVARALHRQSGRPAASFIPVNCPALPDRLLESELFGHTRGAFTDAKTARKGLFLQAEGGTLFLDEIADFPLALQPKLLRALEERRVRPVGSDREVPFDARIVAATNRDLHRAVEDGMFREDLYYRLNVIHLKVPPLRSRGSDILGLAQRFLEEFAGRTGKQVRKISPAVAEKLLAYAWPGNVRELRNAVERAVALTRHDTLVVEDLPEGIRAYPRSHRAVTGETSQALVSLEQVEQQHIQHVLESVDGNKSLAAEILGIDRKTLYRKLERAEHDDAG